MKTNDYTESFCFSKRMPLFGKAILKGLGNIVQMRESCAKVVTSMLDVQLKIIWKF